MHDNTLTDDNRDKFTQIVDRYGQLLKFYNVEELCADRLAEINKYFLNAKNNRFSIAMFYRMFIPHLLSQGIEKAIYLDADLLINLDITELWQIELANHPLAAVTEISNGVEIAKFSALVRDGFAKEEDYFNSGVMLMNLKVLRNEEANILAGIKFRSEHPEYTYFDQEILNYCFATRTLKLPVRFNRLVKQMRLNDVSSVEKEIYHYAGGKFGVGLGPDMNDPFNHLWMNYFIKTPWFELDIASTLIGAHLPPKKNPAVSVIIPLYNAEKYVSECLDSLLAQTFQDFEVIVVDDCSIDSGCKIVESYMPKFNGRLKLYRLKENSGSGGVPRTKAITLSRGEYISFLDADDMFKNYALEEMYSLIKEYDADVIYLEKFYRIDDNGSNMQLRSTKGILVDKPTFEPQDLRGRIGKIVDGWYINVPWLNFVRRDLMIENEVFFPKIFPSEDVVWLYALIFYAKKFVRVPNAVYVYRESEGSMMRKERTPQEGVNFRMNSLINGIKILDELLGRHEFFKENPDCRYALLNRYIKNEVTPSLGDARKIVDYEIYSAIKDRFGDKFDEYDVLIPALCTALYTEKKQTTLPNEFKKFFTARIDIKLMKTEGDFQILSLSDNDANISRPPWFQNNGMGYVIMSSNGEIVFIAKATVDGLIDLNIRGLDVRSPEDKSKRIPYWIDYTSLIINDKTIIDKITPTWHDKPYHYNINVKAGEEIKMQLKWQPHRSDTIEFAPPPPKPESKVTTPPPPKPESKVTTPPPPKPESKVTTPPPPKPESKVTAPPPPKPEPKVATPPPPKPESKVATLPHLYKPESLVPRKFNPFITARIDAKFVSTTGDFQILAISDDKAKITKPGWFQHNGIGYIVHSSDGELTFIAKATADGQISFNLRGMDVRNPDDWTKGIAKRIPYWIDYTKLTVNGKNIFSTRTPAWCDEPYKYAIDVKANEEVTVVIEWQPHNGT